MRKGICLMLCAVLLLTGCSAFRSEPTVYEASFLSMFDTVTTLKGSAESEAAFLEQAQNVHDELYRYHQLFDIYNAYEDVNNLKTVNDMAGIAPVTVDAAIMDLLKDCRSYYELTGGKVNVAMGSVLKLWHEAREAGLADPAHAKLPEWTALEQAAEKISFDEIILDEVNSTVYISNPQVQLDVGAVAKGWATQRVAENAPTGLLISVGGNVCATGPKTAAGDPWIVGIQDPDGGENLHTIYVTGGAVVTSGDYQRVYYVDGQPYHHIIDPATRMPGAYWRSVTVVCADSGLADALSTALFLLPLEDGQALAEKCGAQVLWVNAAGDEFMTPGFGDMIRT